MDNIAAYNFMGPASAQIFSMVMHTLVIWIGVVLVRGYYKVFKNDPSNIAFAMVLLLSSIITTSVILLLNAIAWFFAVCVFCELNNHYTWVQILWTGIYGAGFILFYLILKKRISL